MASWVRFVLSSCRGSSSASWKVYVFVCLVLNVPEKTMEIPSCCGFLLFSSPPLLLSVHPVVLPWCYFAILHQQAAQTECFCMASRAHFSFEIPTRSHEPVHKHGHLFQLCVEPMLRFTVLPHGNRVSCAQCPRKESNKKQMTRLYRKLLISRSSWLFGLSCKCTHVWYARRGLLQAHTRLKTNRHMHCWNKNVVCRPHIHMWKKKRRLCPCRSAFLSQPVTTSICAVLEVFASVITALAKWPVRVRAAFQTENKSRESGKLKAGHFDWLSSLVSEQRCIVGKSPVERERVSFLSFFC